MWAYIDHLDDLLAHVTGHKDDERREPLMQHADRTLFYYRRMEKVKRLDQRVTGILKRIRFRGEQIDPGVMHTIGELFVQAVYLHDSGKINPNYQARILDNQRVAPFDFYDTSHSMLSAVLYLDFYWDKIEKSGRDRKELFLLRYFVCCFSYCISRHHSGLFTISGDDSEEKTYFNDLENMIKKLKMHQDYLRYDQKADRVLETFPLAKIRNTMAKVRETISPVPTYILVKLCYSCIVTCDFFATQSFMKNRNIDMYSLSDGDKHALMEVYAQTKLSRSIRRYQKNKGTDKGLPINRLRSDLFLEAEAALSRHLKEHLFFLEAPTGSGKTNVSIDLALTLLKSDPSLQKLVYVFPFNTLVEQTKETLDNIYPQSMQKKYPITVVNSAEPIVDSSKAANEQVDYDNELLKYQTIQYPVTLTSHVHLFRFLFGSGRQANLGLVHLANSVIIIDEIQSYKNELWPAIALFLNEYAICLNMKIIIMSATLPRIDEFLPPDQRFVTLIKDREKYFGDPVFKDRVQLNYDLLDVPKDELFDRICRIIAYHGQRRYLFEFIYRSAARTFYDFICKKYPDKVVFELTGDDNSYYRKEVIRRINEKNRETGAFVLQDVIVVATQVIEAGLNIDMDIGFKDISLFDSEEQFLGRINRSCMRRDCFAYFFDYSDARVLYRDDARLEYDLRHSICRDALARKDFLPLYKKAFKWLKMDRTHPFFAHIRALRFKDTEEDMRLIDRRTVSLYMPYRLKTGDRIIDGEELWQSFRRLLADNRLSYAEKTVKLSRMRADMSYFTYSFYLKPGALPLYADEDQIVGDLFYISCGSEYMIYDERTGYYKFDREKYQKDSGSPFL